MKEPKTLTPEQIKEIQAEILSRVQENLVEHDRIHTRADSFNLYVCNDSKDENTLVVDVDTFSYYSAEFSITIKHLG